MNKTTSAYKVIKKDTRHSAVILRQCERVHYPKLTPVLAPLNSMGLFLFKERSDAEDWLTYKPDSYLIIECLVPLPYIQYPKEESQILTIHGTDYKGEFIGVSHSCSNGITVPPPEGTITTLWCIPLE